jgi:hypothetical protein
MLKECYWRSNIRSEFINYLNKIVLPEISKTNELFATVLELKNQYFFEEGNFNLVIDNLIFLKENFKSYQNIPKYALFNLGNIYHNTLNDTTNSKKYFDELEDKYPNDLLVWDSKILLGDIDSFPNMPKNANTNIQLADSENQIQTEYKLFENYPNPFNPSTTISYAVPKLSNVSLSIYDMMGKEVKSYIKDGASAGGHNFVWDGTNNNGEKVASGIYIYKFKAISLERDGQLFEQSKKLLLIK